VFYVVLEITCRTEDWPAPVNGGKTSSSCDDGNEVSMGATCAAKCTAGYTLVGSSTTRCSSYGNWIPSNPPNCKGTS
jgi:hypothetical protein